MIKLDEMASEHPSSFSNARTAFDRLMNWIKRTNSSSDVPKDQRLAKDIGMNHQEFYLLTLKLPSESWNHPRF